MSDSPIPFDPDMITPLHPRWDAFQERLAGEGGCRFQHDDEVRWRCAHDHRYSRRILAQMGVEDLDRNLTLLSEQGGHCDCEVLLNLGEASDLADLVEDSVGERPALERPAAI
jgi:hypothetical protein